MFVLRRRPFGVASFREKCFEERGWGLVPANRYGPVVRAELRIEGWSSGEWREADIFFDSGADISTVSARWLAENRCDGEMWPHLTPEGQFVGVVSVRLGEWEFDFPQDRGPFFANQNDLDDHPVAADAGLQQPGMEDMLIGLDFLTLHRLVMIVSTNPDGRGDLSLLSPGADLPRFWEALAPLEARRPALSSR